MSEEAASPSVPVSQDEIVHVPRQVGKRVRSLESGIEGVQQICTTLEDDVQGIKQTCESLKESLCWKANCVAVPTRDDLEVLQGALGRNKADTDALSQIVTALEQALGNSKADNDALVARVAALEQETGSSKSDLLKLSGALEQKVDSAVVQDVSDKAQKKAEAVGQQLRVEMQVLCDSTASHLQSREEELRSKAEASMRSLREEVEYLAQAQNILRDAILNQAETHKKTMERKVERGDVPSNQDFVGLREVVAQKADLASAVTHQQLESLGEQLRTEATMALTHKADKDVVPAREELQAAIDALQGKADIDAVPTHQQVADLEASLRLKADAMNVPTNEHLHASTERLDSRGELLKEQLTASNANLREELQAFCDTATAQLSDVNQALARKADADAVSTKAVVTYLTSDLQVLRETVLNQEDAYRKALQRKADIGDVPTQIVTPGQFKELQDALQMRIDACGEALQRKADSEDVPTTKEIDTLREVLLGKADLQDVLTAEDLGVLKEALDRKADAQNVPSKTEFEELLEEVAWNADIQIVKRQFEDAPKQGDLLKLASKVGSMDENLQEAIAAASAQKEQLAKFREELTASAKETSASAEESHQLRADLRAATTKAPSHSDLERFSAEVTERLASLSLSVGRKLNVDDEELKKMRAKLRSTTAAVSGQTDMELQQLREHLAVLSASVDSKLSKDDEVVKQFASQTQLTKLQADIQAFLLPISQQPKKHPEDQKEAQRSLAKRGGSQRECAISSAAVITATPPLLKRHRSAQPASLTWQEAAAAVGYR